MLFITKSNLRSDAPVYQYACPKCLVPKSDPCVRLRKVRRPNPTILLRAHDERYDVWKAWENLGVIIPTL